MTNPPTSRAIRNPKTRFNWRVSDFIRRMMVWWFELRARITGRGYYCSTLAGQEDYNLTVNSDQTVSCTCQDYEGTAHIGDLRKNTFEEVFFGPVAQRFRDELARGKIPISHLRALHHPAPVQKHRAAQTATAASGDAPGKHCDLQRGLHRLRAGRRGGRSRRQQMSLEDLGRMGDLVARLKMEQLFI